MTTDFRTLRADLETAAAKVEWQPDIFRRASLEEAFSKSGPFEIDFGCGEGAFMLAMAARHPERNYLGVERLLGRVRKVCRKAARGGLANVRVLRLESAYVAKHILPAESASIIHVGFPDPWPKRHHQPRRLIQEDFVRDLRTLLVPGGELRLKTDDLPYFMWMEKVLAKVEGLERIEWPDDPEYPLTNFERRFVEQGLPIHRARLRKV